MQELHADRLSDAPSDYESDKSSDDDDDDDDDDMMILDPRRHRKAERGLC
jgi:hypothetical protein